ncbi:MAG TPA: peptidoglycan-binding protein LysM [Candidatus Nanoarchaeia archaeon]|nr:peptidoglycan-binding protein LysM [Candidatus Nanoarchaeia archaeon]
MEKAKIHVLEGKGDLKDKLIEVMFNPTDYTSTINAKWEGGMIPTFTETTFGTLTLNLFFDTYELRADVREDNEIRISGKKVAGTKRIMELAVPTVEGEVTKRPPVCLFSWGKFNFKGVVQSVTQKFTMFMSTGIPVRATLTVIMKPVVNAQDIVKLKGVEACRKIRQVKQGERLDIIAAEELKDPFLWRKIAELNDIDDPLNFPGPDDIGKIIIIPD